MNPSSRSLGWPSVALLVAIAVIATAFVTNRLHGSSDTTGSATSFTGKLASLDSSGRDGCIAADPGQGVDTGAQENCGPIYVTSGRRLTVGEKLQATFIDTQDSTGEAVQGYLVSTAG